jgi:Sulfotransferase domain
VAAESLTTGPPDFVGVGAQRAGTTWWFRLLAHHPAIRAPRGRKKELHFFDRFCAREMDDADIAAYHDLFPRSAGQISGEWTPRYMGDVQTPRLLKRVAPDARLLVLLRDPIERFRSGMIHRLTRAPQRSWELSAADAIERGRYARQLDRLRLFFEDDRILVLQYEKCRAEPSGEYARTLRFLGVADDFAPTAFEEQKGTTMAARKQELWPDIETALRLTLEPEVERLRTMVPGIDLGLWPNFSHLATGAGATA